MHESMSHRGTSGGRSRGAWLLAMAAVAALALPASVGAADASPEPVRVTTEQGLPSDEVQFIKQDAAGTIWVGTMGGLVRFEGGDPSKAEVVPIEGAKAVWDIHPTEDGGAWVGTDRELAYIKDGETKVGIEKRTVYPLVKYGDGLAALAKDPRSAVSSLVYMDPETKQWSPVEALEGRHCEDLMVGASGRMYASVEGDGVFVFAPASGLKPVAHHLAGQSATATFEDPAKRLWVGVWNRGIAVHDGSKWHWSLTDAVRYVFRFKSDDQGRVWASTSTQGLWIFDGIKPDTQMLKEEGAVNVLVPTPSAGAWASTQMSGGVMRFDGKEWTQMLPDEPLPMSSVVQMDNGDVWVGGVLSGIYIFPADKVKLAAEQK